MAKVERYICDVCVTKSTENPVGDKWFQGVERDNGYSIYNWGYLGGMVVSDMCSKTCALEAQSKALGLASRT